MRRFLVRGFANWGETQLKSSLRTSLSKAHHSIRKQSATVVLIIPALLRRSMRGIIKNDSWTLLSYCVNFVLDSEVDFEVDPCQNHQLTPEHKTPWFFFIFRSVIYYGFVLKVSVFRILIRSLSIPRRILSGFKIDLELKLLSEFVKGMGLFIRFLLGIWIKHRANST